MSWNQPRGPGGWSPYGYGPPMGGNYNWGMPPGPRGPPPGFGGPMRPPYWGAYGGAVRHFSISRLIKTLKYYF